MGRHTYCSITKAKGGGVMKVLLFTLITCIVSIASANDLSKALGAALLQAETDHAGKQVALEVDTGKIEQAQFRRNQAPKVVELNASAEVDRSVYSTKEEADEIEVEDSGDISKEVNDN
jgi:hypothetical protein